MQPVKLVHRHLIISKDADVDLGINFTQALDQIVGKGIVVIDHDDHGAFFAVDVNGKMYSWRKKIFFGYQLKRSLASPDTVPIMGGSEAISVVECSLLYVISRLHADARQGSTRSCFSHLS